MPPARLGMPLPARTAVGPAAQLICVACPPLPRASRPQDFATLQSMLDEIQQNIALRQDTISLLTGEVQRLRTQMGGLEGSGLNTSSMSASSNGRSASSGSLQLGPGSPSDKAANMAASMLAQRAERPSRAAAAGSFLENAGLFSADKSTQANVAAYAGAVAGIVFLGGVVAPVVEDKLGLGGELRCKRKPGLCPLQLLSHCTPSVLHRVVLLLPGLAEQWKASHGLSVLA